jgi:hypothetical protein
MMEGKNSKALMRTNNEGVDGASNDRGKSTYIHQFIRRDFTGVLPSG